MFNVDPVARRDHINRDLDFSGITFGKVVGDHLYLHVSALDFAAAECVALVGAAELLGKVSRGIHFNVVKLARSGHDISLLYYVDFFDTPFPSLSRSWRLSLSRQSVVFRTYEESRNPPILHRKELLLPPDHPRKSEYTALTEAAKSIGLFKDPNRIGFREYWLRLIAEHGYELVGSEFVPIANSIRNDEPLHETASAEIRRHLTALSRANFSAPVQALSRNNLISQDKTFFDYGCGRGDDVRGLLANGIAATGWDPHFAPDDEKRVADVTNLGFVINVIEDLQERIDALKGAYAHTRGVLSVAAMLTSQTGPEGRPYGDGYISSRNTFQKYFTQAQLRDFIEHTLDESAIAAGPGVFFVFRDKDLEQRFLSTRYGRKAATILSHGWVHERPRREPRQKTNRESQLLDAHRSFFDALWAQCLEHGRIPDKEEIEGDPAADVPQEVGSLARAFRILKDHYDEADLQRTSAARIADIIVLLALQQFQKRKPYRHLEPRLQRDIRYFFGDYAQAQRISRQTLFSIGTSDAIDNACREAANRGYGHIQEGHSLQLHASLLERLPALLRVYVGCATLLYGDVAEFDLIKIHIRSGKVTLLKFDAFETSPLPRLVQRIKVKLRDQDMDVFNYGAEYPPPLLYYKSRYVNEEFSTFSEQVAFEEALEGLALFDLTGYGPGEADFSQALERARWQIDGFTLVRSRRIPALDEPCGENFTYRRLIECGETQRSTGIANLPMEAESYTALYELARNVLDPVVEYFGTIRLTHGFCSSALAKHITLGIAPKLDQHAAFEKTRSGRYICDRLGAACDFLIDDEDMFEVARWIHENLPANRIYVYERDRPIHVSYSGGLAEPIVYMMATASGKRVPRSR
jgi:DNA phosphorothioation-associated putative methyltransferase